MYTPTQGQIGADPNNGVNSQSPGKPCCNPPNCGSCAKTRLPPGVKTRSRVMARPVIIADDRIDLWARRRARLHPRTDREPRWATECGGDQGMIQRASQPSTGVMATVVASVTLLAGASGVFAQLQDSLNSVWGGGAEGRSWYLERDHRPLHLGRRTLRNRLLAIGVAWLECRALGLWQMVWRMAPGTGVRLTRTRARHLTRGHYRPLRTHV